MHGVEQSVPGKRGGGDPQARLETDNRKGGECEHADDLRHQARSAASHDREQGIIGRHHDRHDRVKGAVAVEAGHFGEDCHGHGQRNPDDQRHVPSLVRAYSNSTMT